MTTPSPEVTPEYLRKLASDLRSFDSSSEVALDVDAAARNLEHLKDYAARLERKVENREEELAQISGKLDQLSAARQTVIDMFKPELQELIREVMNESPRLNAELQELIREVVNESPGLDSDDIRQEVRNMILDGDITVSLDYT